MRTRDPIAGKGPARRLRLRWPDLRSAPALPALLAACCLALPLASPASAQTRAEIRAQDQQLYQQYQSGDQDQSGNPTAPPLDGGGADQGTYSPSPGRSGGGANGLLAQLVERVARLEDENRTLAGRVDELDRALQQQGASLNKQIGDLQFAMQQGGHAAVGAPVGGGVAPQADPAPAPGAMRAPAARATMAPTPVRTPEAALRAGNLALDRHDYATAQDQARAALATGGTAHAASAEYLLAQSYGGQHNYQQAAVAYYDAYNRQPHGPLAPDALLRVGSSMIALGQNGAACEALSKFRSEFPSPRPGLLRASATLRTRAHC